jgi:hypothetical protein
MVRVRSLVGRGLVVALACSASVAFAVSPAAASPSNCSSAANENIIPNRATGICRSGTGRYRQVVECSNQSGNWGSIDYGPIVGIRQNSTAYCEPLSPYLREYYLEFFA